MKRARRPRRYSLRQCKTANCTLTMPATASSIARSNAPRHGRQDHTYVREAEHDFKRIQINVLRPPHQGLDCPVTGVGRKVRCQHLMRWVTRASCRAEYNVNSRYQLSIRGEHMRRTISAWLVLGLVALIAAGIFSILLVVARTPVVQRWTPFIDFFQVALVVHVNLSVLIWLLSVSAAMWCLVCSSQRTIVGQKLAWLSQQPEPQLSSWLRSSAAAHR